MSSRRSASDGTRIGTTASRWNRSSRSVPSSIAAARSRAEEEMMRTSTWTSRRAADALEGLVDEHAQDLGLRVLGHVGDFVEEQRAAMGLLERADLALAVAALRGRKARSPCSPGVIVAALMTTKGAAGAGGGLVDAARGEFLAGARRAGDEHARIDRRDAWRSSAAADCARGELPTMRSNAPARWRSAESSRRS